MTIVTQQLLSNAKKVQRLLDTTSNIGTNNDNTEHSDEQTLLSVMISSMNHMVTTADTNTDHGDNSNNVTTRSTFPLFPWNMIIIMGNHLQQIIYLSTLRKMGNLQDKRFIWRIKIKITMII